MAEKWFSRTFKFDVPASRLPLLIERLRGVPARIEEKVKGFWKDDLCRRVDGTWSPQENIGHLTDLEALHMKRLDELEAGLPILTAADVSNKKTWDALHNDQPIEQVLRAFRKARGELVTRLEEWNPARLEVSAVHPRLKTPMRVVDLAYFVAEHDDSHLTRIEEILRGKR
jgi:hypothetical protein